jgi:small ligand-binding sensory domain FIST
MPFSAALSTRANTSAALDDVCTQALAALPGSPALAALFFSPHHAAADDHLTSARQRLGARCLIGCVGESIVGVGREVEDGPALSLWLGAWTTLVDLQPCHLTAERTPDGPSLLGWPDGLESADPTQSTMLLLGDPLTFPIDDFLGAMNDSHAGLRVVGGMASGSGGPGQTRLLLDDTLHSHGAIGVLLQGQTGVRSIVSQGCRPIGAHMIITRVGGDNVIAELGGQTPLVRLQSLWKEVSPADQALMQRGLHVGLVIDEYRGDFRRGDFLVRNVLGLDPQTGAIAVGDRVRVGQTVQFHVRDAASADEDLTALLQSDRGNHPRPPGGALLFTCNGRGTRLFPEPNHDARVLGTIAGNVPLAGFFAQGELGPVGGRNFIHGFTASTVLFEE